tara:strand:- start:11 stop:292 length:282 start_codon:yes stop_codon:yes gene_type:complete
MPGYMQGSKAARHTSSISNRGSVFGIMAGLPPKVGTNSNQSVTRHMLIKGSKGLPFLSKLTPPEQKKYLADNNLLSVNPLSSGGVGKKSLYFG